MRSPVVRIIGYGLMGLLLTGAFWIALRAAQRGQIFLWKNYWNQPIAAGTILITFGLIGVIGVIWVAQRLWRAWRVRPGARPRARP